MAKVNAVLMLTLLLMMLIMTTERTHWFIWISVFWSIALIWGVLTVIERWRNREWWTYCIRLVGFVSNAVVMLVNQGRMPAEGITAINRWWQPITSQTRLVVLSDVIFGASVGDVFILTSALIYLIYYLTESKPINDPLRGNSNVNL